MIAVTRGQSYDLVFKLGGYAIVPKKKRDTRTEIVLSQPSTSFLNLFNSSSSDGLSTFDD